MRTLARLLFLRLLFRSLALGLRFRIDRRGLLLFLDGFLLGTRCGQGAFLRQVRGTGEQEGQGEEGDGAKAENGLSPTERSAGKRPAADLVATTL